MPDTRPPQAAPVRCLLLTRFTRTGSSSRVRHLQYLPYLASRGIEVDERPLLDEAYLQQRYAGRHVSPGSLVAAYGRRLRTLLRSRRYDLIWLEKELFPLLPAWLEHLLPHVGVPYVVDYDDAVFHNYELHGSSLVRRLLGRKIDAVMRHAALVTVGNAYLEARARQAGARRVERLPSVVSLAHYPPAPLPVTDVFTVGWMGSPVTTKYLHRIEPALRQLAQTGPVRLYVVGGTFEPEGPLDLVTAPWSEAREAEQIRSFDVGVMPLDDTPWEAGKCGYKLIQYMACGRPVVASPVGINREIVTPGTNGFLATDTAAWVEALGRLRADPALRAHLGEEGRRRVEATYCLEVTAPRLAGWLLETGRRRG